MRTDYLTSGPVDRAKASTLQYKMVRGSITDLLITNSTTFHFKDKLTVKLRHAGGLLTVVDRVSLLRLAELTDFKRGMPTTGTPDFIGDANGENSENNGLVRVNQGVQYYQNAVLIALGHITLTGAEELEITIESAPMPAPAVGVTLPIGTVKLISVSSKSRVDTILTYDESADLESQQGAVREIYLVGKNNNSFFVDGGAASYGLPKAKDIQIKLGVDGDDSENDIETYGAMSAITGQLTYQPNALIRLFQDVESVAANVYVKVYGADKADAELLYIRETQVPHMVAQSIMAAVSKEQKRVEVIEANEPERAKALQQSGAIASSADLQKAKDNFAPAVASPSK